MSIPGFYENQYPPPREQQWLTIETAPKGIDALFWIRAKTVDDDHYVDTSGNPILAHCQPRMVMGKYGQWSSLMKATHWMPLPSPPPQTPERSPDT